MERYDERDIMFARMERKPGTKQYEDYYKKNPDKKEIDDQLREKPTMGDESARFYHPYYSKMVDSTFQLISELNTLCKGPEKEENQVEVSIEENTEKIKELAKLYGAKLIGITEYNSNYYYTHKGRKDIDYGKKINDKLPYTIVFAVEMDYDYFMQSPYVLEAVAASKGYLEAGMVGLVLTYFIKSLGYKARNHMDGNYQIVLPLAAKYANLGDIGRNGLLLTPEYGGRIRLGAVTTDLPLIIDEQESSFSVTKFCNECKICSKVCPSQAIAGDEREKLNFNNKWSTIQEKCYGQWQIFGSDCGLCVSRCPFSTRLPKESIEEYINNPESAGKIIEEYKQSLINKVSSKSD